MTLLPILAYWALAFWGLASRKPVLLWLVVLSIPFGSFAVLPPGLTGGLTFIPTTMTALLMCLREFFLRRRGMRFLLRALFRLDRGLLLFLFWLVALVVTLFMPRLLAGQMEVVPMRGTGVFMETALLRPTSQNISQLMYLTVSVGSVFAFFSCFQRRGMAEVFLKVWMVGAMLVVGTGLLDLMSQYLPIGPLLAPFRTATYALLTDIELSDGSKRIVGLMPEASSYGAICLTFLTPLYFLRPAYPSRKLRRRAGWLCVALTLCTVLSTSSAAYVGIAVLGALVVLDWWRRASGLEQGRMARRGIIKDFVIALTLIGAFATVVLLRPSTLDPVVARVQTMVFEKAETDSYLERSMWTRTAIEAGIKSHFVGVGIGSARASNNFAAVFGATGLLGVLLYYGFQLFYLFRRLPPETGPSETVLAKAFRWSFYPTFIVGLLIGTSPDFGISGALRWGMLLAICVPAIARATARQPEQMTRPGMTRVPARKFL